MGYKTCSRCGGQGRVFFGSYKSCTMCGGTGTMYVADTVKYPTNGGKKNNRNTIGGARSIHGSYIDKGEKFDEFAANILSLSGSGYLAYVCFTHMQIQLGITLFIGFISFITLYKLLKGPLRFILTVFAYALMVAIILFFIWIFLK